MRIILYLLLAAVNFLGILPFLGYHYISVDLAETVYHARELCDGKIPYRDIFTHHFLGYVLPFAAIQCLTPITPTLLWGITYAVNLVSSLLIGKIVHQITSSESAGWVASFLGVTVGWFWGWGGVTLNVQSCFLPLLLVACLVSLQLLHTDAASDSHQRFRSSILALTLGVLVTFDQRLFFFLPLFFAALLKQRKGRVLSLALFLAFPALCLALLAHFGALSEFVKQTIVFPLQYRNEGAVSSFPTTARLLYLGGLGAEFFPLVGSAIGLCYLFVFNPHVGLFRFVLVYLLCASCYVAIGARPYAHYLLIYSPIVILLIALAFHFGFSRPKRERWVVQSFVVCLMVLTALKPFIVSQDPLNFMPDPHEDVVLNTAKSIRSSVSQSHNPNILVWGYSPQIYLLSDTVSEFRDMSLLSVSATMEKEFKEYLRRQPPSIIVRYTTTQTACGRTEKVCPQPELDFETNDQLLYLREYLSTRYHRTAKFTSEFDSAEIYHPLDLD